MHHIVTPEFVDIPCQSECTAGKMDREAGWWTTSGKIGLLPLARVMGVGRQQCHLHSFLKVTRHYISCSGTSQVCMYESQIMIKNVIEEGTMKVLQKIKTNTSPGPYMMHPRVLYQTRNNVCKPLYKILKHLQILGSCQWTGKKLMLHIYTKKRSKVLASNY